MSSNEDGAYFKGEKIGSVWVNLNGAAAQEMAPPPPKPVKEKILEGYDIWVCKDCGKPGTRGLTPLPSPEGKVVKPGVMCRCTQPRWEIFNTETGETKPAPGWWRKRYPENS